jgi:multisubunit Na+/H+ antiporter MnhF subunit
MKTSIPRKIKHSLLVEAEEFSSLWTFISSRYGEVKAVAECNDKTELDTEDISDILNFENPNYRKITSITISAQNSYNETLRVQIGGQWPQAAKFNLESQSYEFASHNSQELIKLFSEMKPGYDLFARINVMYTFIAVTAVLSLLRTIGIVFHIISFSPPMPDTVSSLDIFNIVLLALIVLFGVLVFFEWLRVTLFPKVFFMLGKQKKKMEQLIKWRWFAFSAIGAAILASVIGGLIVEKLK